MSIIVPATRFDARAATDAWLAVLVQGAHPLRVAHEPDGVIHAGFSKPSISKDF